MPKLLPRMFLAALLVLSVFFLLACFAYAEGGKSGVVTADVLNVREGPDLSAKILFKLYRGTKVKLLENSGDWSKVNCNDTVVGWVFSQYVSIREEPIGTGTISAYDVNVRCAPDLASEVVMKLDKGFKAEVFARAGQWYKILLNDDKTGWVYEKYIIVKENSTSRGVVEEIPVPDNTPGNQAGGSADSSGDKGNGGGGENPGKPPAEPNVQEKLAEFAKKFLGVKYVWGGDTPKGFDCSGFALYVYKNFGIELPHQTSLQAKGGTVVTKKNLRIGDLVFFDTNGGKNGINHVGIYIGNGKFIHASSARSTKKVVISDLNEGFYARTYMRARRYIK